MPEHRGIGNLVGNLRDRFRKPQVTNEHVRRVTLGHPDHLLGREDVNAYFDELKNHEAKPASPDDSIYIGSIKTNNQEFLRITQSGLKKADLEAGRVRRGDLLEAGFSFVNRAGAGEKPLLSGSVEVDGVFTDLGSRRLLTAQEIRSVIDRQYRENPELPKPASPEMDAMRKDMLSFLLTGHQLIRESGSLSVQAFDTVYRRMVERGEIKEGDVTEYLAEGRQRFRFFSEQELYTGLIASSMVGIDLVKLRGIPISAIGIRTGKLHYDFSPFLDSGFQFDHNYDLTLYNHDYSRTQRLNMVVWHLLSRGLSEMGGSLNGSHDQLYMTGADYYHKIYPERGKGATLGELTEAEASMVAERIKVRLERKVY